LFSLPPAGFSGKWEVFGNLALLSWFIMGIESPAGHPWGSRRTIGDPALAPAAAFPRRCGTAGQGHRKGAVVVLYDEPDASKFIAVVQRLKRRQRRAARQTRQAKQKLRNLLRKLRG
jgi:hypothetical protein